MWAGCRGRAKILAEGKPAQGGTIRRQHKSAHMEHQNPKSGLDSHHNCGNLALTSVVPPMRSNAVFACQKFVMRQRSIVARTSLARTRASWAGENRKGPAQPPEGVGPSAPFRIGASSIR